MKQLIIAFTLVVACNPRVADPTKIESESGCAEACDHMKTNFPECPEGNDKQCVPGCTRTFGLGYIWIDGSSGPMCIVQATTKGELRNCNVECAEQ